MSGYLIIIILFLVASFFLGFFSDYLNVKNISIELPTEFEGYYDKENN